MDQQEAATIDYYDKNASMFIESSINASMAAVCDLFLSYLPVSATIMDLGCGSGRDSLYFAKKGYMVLPVDGSVEMCRAATEISGIKAVHQTFEEIDYNNEFDGVWACASLLHVSKERIPYVLKKINGALKENGILYMSFKYGIEPIVKNGRFFTNLTENDIQFLCNSETGFETLMSFVSEDVRIDRKGEKWINIIAKKG